MHRPTLPLALLLTVLPAPARAELIPVSFEATINTVSPPLDAGFTVGETVTGTFLVDTEATDLEPVPDEGNYDGVSNFAADFGGYAVTASSLSLLVRNGTGFMVDSFYVDGEPTGADVGGLAPGNFILNLGDEQNTVFSSEAIPLTLSLAEFESANVSLLFPDGGFSRAVNANITELTYGVPEPAAPLLTAVGALALACRMQAGRRRGSRR